MSAHQKPNFHNHSLQKGEHLFLLMIIIFWEMIIIIVTAVETSNLTSFPVVRYFDDEGTDVV
jgi:hypothetical protein